MIADSDSGEDAGAGAYPAVDADMDRGIELIRRRAPQFRKDRVTRSADYHIRTKHGAIADVYVRVIHKGEVVIDVHMVSEVEKATAPVRKKKGGSMTLFSPISASISCRSISRFSTSCGRVWL